MKPISFRGTTKCEELYEILISNKLNMNLK